MFKLSFLKLKSVRYLAFMAIMIALKTAFSFYYVPVGENLRIYFTFLIVGIEGMVLGPVSAGLSGLITDLVSFLIHPTGPFFPGYTLSSILSGMIYGIFLFQPPCKLYKVCLAKLSVNLFVNIGLGSLWSAMLFSKGYYYYLAKSAIKNVLLLPIEIILLYLTLKVVLPHLKRSGFLK